MFQFQDLTLENDSQHHSYENNGIKFNPYSFRPIEEVNQISFVREILKIMWYMFSEGISGWRISEMSDYFQTNRKLFRVVKIYEISFNASMVMCSV